MTRRITVFALFCAVVACAAVAQAVPVFYLSSQNAGATPGLLSLTGQPANTNGQMYLWTNSDVRLSGVSLDIVETGGAIKFTGVDVSNPAGPPARWFALDGPQVITNSSITNVGGAAIPGLSGDGVGAGSTAGANVLLATINYMTLGSGTSNLELKIGSNTVADFNGAFPQVRFGTDSAPLVNGDAVGMGGAAGSIGLGGGVLPPDITPIDLGQIFGTGVITANLQASNGPNTWTALTPSSGTPALAATLTPEGGFSWDPAGSRRGPLGNGVQYSWMATASNGPDSSDTAVAITLTLVPEPATISLFGLAMIGVLGLIRRRS
jgi:hypothetical protein